MEKEIKYNKIVFLVHPLFTIISDTTMASIFDFSNKNFNDYNYAKELIGKKLPTEKEVLEFIKKNKAFKTKLKKSLAEYGKKLISYKKEPNTLVIIVNSYNAVESYKKDKMRFFLGLFPSKEFHKMPLKELRKTFKERADLFEKLNKHLLNPFYNFAKKNLGNNVIIINDVVKDFEVNFLLNSHNFKKKQLDKILSKIDKKIKLRVFGEWSDMCVNTIGVWSKDYFESKNRKVLDYKILYDSSISSPYSKIESINNRFLYGSKRRKEQQKKKREKLRERLIEKKKSIRSKELEASKTKESSKSIINKFFRKRPGR